VSDGWIEVGLFWSAEGERPTHQPEMNHPRFRFCVLPRPREPELNPNNRALIIA
jgi:hypothetical protein